ncbi:MAG TPA: hypothetical protein VFX49_21685 [Chloroflexota bacterium]|nr:hypothetical protein [Chloroflexota bacterium]
MVGRALAALMLALAALGVTGCIGYEEHVTFTATGSGTFQLKFGFDTTLLKSLGDGSEPPEAPTINRDELVEQFGENVEVEPLSEEVDGRTYEGFRLKIGFDSPDVFAELAETVSEGAAERADDDTGNLAAQMTLTVSGETYTLTGSIPPMFEGEDKTAPFAKLLFGTSRRLFILTLPGRVTAVNADSRDGQTYTWRLDPMSSTARQISATWVATGEPRQSVNPTP